MGAQHIQKKFSRTTPSTAETEPPRTTTAVPVPSQPAPPQQQPRPSPTPSPTASSSGSKLSDKLKKISISSDRVVKRGSQKGTRRVLAGPDALARSAIEPPSPSSPPPPQTSPPPPQPQGSAWENFGSDPDDAVFEPDDAGFSWSTQAPDPPPMEEASDHPSYPPPSFLSPIEEAKRKWEEANALRPPSFRAADPPSSLPPMAEAGPLDNNSATSSPSHYSSHEFGEEDLSFTKDDGWNAAPNSPLLLKSVSRTMSNTSQNRRQQLCQVVHDFMADAEDELTVWAGDVVEVVAEDDGWYQAKVFNEDGSFESGLIPASYCIEWNEDETSSFEGGRVSPRVSPRNSLRSMEAPDFAAAPPWQPPPEEFVWMREVVSAEFAGNALRRFRVAGHVTASDALIGARERAPVEFAVVGSHGQEDSSAFGMATFFLNDSVGEGGVFARDESAIAFRLKGIPPSLQTEGGGGGAPLLRYSVPKDACGVPLVMQMTWCQRALSLDNKVRDVVISVLLSPSPRLPKEALRSFQVTLEGLPALTTKTDGSGEPAKLLCSHRCQYCPKEAKIRWDLGTLSGPTCLRVVAREAPPGKEREDQCDFPPGLRARAHFCAPGSVSGFGLGMCGPHRTDFVSGDYSCTPDYKVTAVAL